MNIFDTENAKLLMRAFAEIKTESDCRLFLEDLMTSKELETISQRLRVAELLLADATYAEVVSATGASSATIGRVNRCIRYGNGGYEKALNKIGGTKK